MVENAMKIAAVLGPMTLIMGLSILIYAPQWRKLEERWEKDHFELFSMMLFSGAIGLIIINMYNVWEWNVWLIVTIAGWSALLKSVVYFLLPGSTWKSLMKFSKSMIYFGGLVTAVLGAVLTYYVYIK
ncbi:MAG: hypothetical protein O3B47_03660 [bacterium]|nr:hypothetical protein [bacterium]